MQVHWNKKGSCWKHFLEHMEAMHEGVCHVVTFQRHDVGLTNTEVNNKKRRDVATSQRQHGICTSSFKASMVQNEGYREAYERGHGIPEQQ